MGAIFDQSYYDILEINQSATKDEVIRAYHRAKSAYSTNSPALYSVFSKEETDELLKMIDEAYSVLLNPERRRKYDESIFNQQQQEENTGQLLDLKAVVVNTNEKQDSGLIGVVPSSSLNQVARLQSNDFKINHEFEKEIQSSELFEGQFLKRIREYRNITLDMVAEQTRIGRNYLTALEANDFKSLPATVFVRGFLVQYAKILGLHEKKVADSYLRNAKNPIK